jgi:hypothetical protein
MYSNLISIACQLSMVGAGDFESEFMLGMLSLSAINDEETGLLTMPFAECA